MDICKLIAIPYHWSICFRFKWIKISIGIVITSCIKNYYRVLYCLFCGYIRYQATIFGYGLLFKLINNYIFIFQTIILYELFAYIIVKIIKVVLSINIVKYVTYKDLKYPQIGSLMKLNIDHI